MYRPFGAKRKHRGVKMAIEDVALERLKNVDAQAAQARRYIRALREAGIDTTTAEVELAAKLKEAEDLKASIEKNLMG